MSEHDPRRVLQQIERLIERRDLELLTCEEADKLLGRRKGYTYQRILDGELEYTEQEPGRIRVPVFVLRGWLGRQLKRRRAA